MKKHVLNRSVIGLDIGTTKIAIIVCHVSENGKIKIDGFVKIPSIGLNEGIVYNLDNTTACILKAKQEVEKKFGVEVVRAVVGIAGKHIRSTQTTEYLTRDNPDTRVTKADIDKLETYVRKLQVTAEETIVHIKPQEYKLDGKTGITNPIGSVRASKIEGSYHVIIGQTSDMNNIEESVRDAGIEMDDILLESLASANSVLVSDEKEVGVVLVDIGGGTTDLAIFKNNQLRHTAVIPIGGNKITEEIKNHFSITHSKAEYLKLSCGDSWAQGIKTNKSVLVEGIRGRPQKEINVKSLSKVIASKVNELVMHILSEIERSGHFGPQNTLGAGVVITGGGSQLKNIGTHMSSIMGMEVRVGTPNEYLSSETDKTLHNPSYSTAVGLALHGIINSRFNEKIPVKKSSEKDNTKNNVMKWIKKCEEFFSKKTKSIKDFFDNLD